MQTVDSIYFLLGGKMGKKRLPGIYSEGNKTVSFSLKFIRCIQSLKWCDSSHILMSVLSSKCHVNQSCIRWEVFVLVWTKEVRPTDRTLNKTMLLNRNTQQGLTKKCTVKHVYVFIIEVMFDGRIQRKTWGVCIYYFAVKVALSEI